jgi:DNA polymerase III subunit epsilon
MRRPLAFVDLETSGLSPATGRVIEIGVITVNGDAVSEWTTLVNPLVRLGGRGILDNSMAGEALEAAPRFRDIAGDLYSRLAGHVLVAHNARFDFGFLKAEFRRLGVEFEPQVLCTVMLSRKLYPGCPRHDLDTLAERHGLEVDVRHRALPDARLIWRFWQFLQREHANEHLAAVVEALLAGPVLPAHLDPALIERLPEGPGVYALHGGEDEVLHSGTAGNIKAHLMNYFRIDRMSLKALAVSHLVKDIKWRATCGPIGAHLQLRMMSRAMAAKNRRPARRCFSWKLIPEGYPCLELVSLSNYESKDNGCYGLFSSERKARNGLLRSAARKQLCHALLGIRESSATSCTACRDGATARCGSSKGRLRHLSRIVAALGPERVTAWPYQGPIGVRERSDLHIIEYWRYLGSARTEGEIYRVLEHPAPAFEPSTFAFLVKTLTRLPQRRIVRLPRCPAAQAERHLDWEPA